METLGWIFLGLLTVSLFLFILGSIKNWEIMIKISRIFIVPFTCVIILLFLKQLFPDSRHIFFLTTIALTLISLCELCFSFESLKFFRYFGRFLFLLSNAAWIELFISTFYIYRPAQWMNILFAGIYFVILVLLLIICGKNKIGTYMSILIGYASVILLNYSAIITWIFSKREYAVFLTTGTTILLLSFILYEKQKTKPWKINERIELIIRTLLITCAEALITASTIFMIR